MRSHSRSDSQDEEACMLAIAAGSTRAFRAVMETYMRDVFRFSYSITGDPGLAEDVTQETFTRLWTHGSSWSPKGRLRSWLLKIAHNLCIDEIRRMKGHVNIDDMAVPITDKRPGPRETLSQNQSADIVRAALLRLPERQRAALMLVHYHDCTNIDAADIMDISVDALESLLARGRKTLKDFLSNQKHILLGD